MTIRHDDTVCDSEAARLLPWLVMGQLDAQDAARAEEHIAGCPVCRADRDEQYRLRDLVQSEDNVEYSPQPALQKLMSRIDEMERELTFDATGDALTPELPAARSVAAVPRWLLAAVLVQTIGLGLLGAAVWRYAATDTVTPRYQTLTAASISGAGAPQLRVVFAPVTTLAELADLLGSVRATIVAGPSEAGAYTLALPDDQARPHAVAAHVASLRADPHVLFAEPVAGTQRPAQ
jgi:uncharacterized membrane protein YidH (DUF202 family)